QAVRARGLPGPAVLRPHAPVPAGAGAACRLAHAQRAGEPPAARPGTLEVRQPAARGGGRGRPARRRLAGAAQPRHAGGGGRVNAESPWLAWTGIHMTPWKVIGLVGALMFGTRWVVQFVATRRAGRPVIPRAFWVMSLVGSSMTLAYFLFSAKQDAVGI